MNLIILSSFLILLLYFYLIHRERNRKNNYDYDIIIIWSLLKKKILVLKKLFFFLLIFFYYFILILYSVKVWKFSLEKSILNDLVPFYLFRWTKHTKSIFFICLLFFWLFEKYWKNKEKRVLFMGAGNYLVIKNEENGSVSVY